MSVGTQIFNRTATLKVADESGEGRDFSNLRIRFNIAKSSESNSNTSKITVLNLNKESRSFVEQEKLVVILQAGYTPIGTEKPLEESIFQGNVEKVENKLAAADWQTTFEVGDGEKVLVENHFDKGFAKGVKLSAAIEEVAASLGKPISVIKGIRDKVFKNGISLSGATKEILDTLTVQAGVEWSIQDDEIIILPQEQSDDESSFLLSRDTGLIGSPIKREKGVELVSTLNGLLRPGRPFEVQSRFVNGVFRVRKVNHNGDTHEGPWESKVEAV